MAASKDSFGARATLTVEGAEYDLLLRAPSELLAKTGQVLVEFHHHCVVGVSEADNERVIEIREGAQEQVIQAQLKKPHSPSSEPSPSQGSSAGAQPSSLMPGIVACSNCGSRFAESHRGGP